MKLKSIDPDLYESCLEKYPYQSFLHSSYAGNKLKHNGWNVEYLGYFNHDDCVACCLCATLPLMKVFRYAYIPRGMIIDYKDKALLQAFVRDIKQYLKTKNVVFLEIDPNIPYQQRDKDGQIVENGLNNFQIVSNLEACGFEHLEMSQGYKPNQQCRWVSGIDLVDRTKDEIFAEFSYMTRQDIRTSMKYQVQIRELQKDELYILDEMEKQTSEHQGFEASSLSYYQ
ncbi:MAG: peptidoglycan bridge formation glycyltransferase FemA/FemB family protein, partial [Floccifex sp.]